jgi:long-chain acyl-CoA synthetase
MDAIATRLIQRGSPFELQDALINGIQCRMFPKGPQTLLDIFRKAVSFPQREFLVADESRLSMGHVIDAASGIYCRLRTHAALMQGRRVAIIMRNCPEWIAAFIAVVSSGAPVVAIHAGAYATEILDALQDAQCHLAICDADEAQKLKDSSWNGEILLATDPAQPNTAVPLDFDDDVSPDAEALIAFTSGTTGRAKGIVLSHRNLVSGMMNMMLGGALTTMRSGMKPTTPASAPCTLMLSPLSYIGGYAQLLLMLYLGGKIILMSEWNALRAATFIAKERIKSISGAAPEMLRELAELDQTQHDLASLSNLSLFGSALQTEVKHLLFTAFPQVTLGTGYGMTETCGSVCVTSGNELAQYPLSSGLVLPSVDLRVVDADGSEMAAGETGEIWIRGAMVMKRYLGDAAAEFPQQGWFKTGDLGRVDPDGRLYVLDRIKNVLKWNGSLISMSATEALAKSCAGVADAAVAGLAVTDEGQELVLAFTPSNANDHLAAELEETIVQKSTTTLPRLRLIACDDLPKTVSGKIKRETLRRWLVDAKPQLHFQPLSQRN